MSLSFTSPSAKVASVIGRPQCSQWWSWSRKLCVSSASPSIPAICSMKETSKTCSPTWMRSPCFTVRRCMRSPFTKTPLRLFMSTTVHSPLEKSKAQWIRERWLSRTFRSAVEERPTVTTLPCFTGTVSPRSCPAMNRNTAYMSRSN